MRQCQQIQRYFDTRDNCRLPMGHDEALSWHHWPLKALQAKAMQILKTETFPDSLDHSRPVKS